MSRGHSRRAKERRQASKQQAIELKMEDVTAIVEKAKAALSAEEHSKLKAAMDTLAFLTQELQTKKTSLERLRKMLFGAKTEKTSQVLGGEEAPGEPGSPEPSVSLSVRTHAIT